MKRIVRIDVRYETTKSRRRHPRDGEFKTVTLEQEFASSRHARGFAQRILTELMGRPEKLRVSWRGNSSEEIP